MKQADELLHLDPALSMTTVIQDSVEVDVQHTARTLSAPSAGKRAKKGVGQYASALLLGKRDAECLTGFEDRNRLAEFIGHVQSQFDHLLKELLHVVLLALFLYLSKQADC